MQQKEQPVNYSEEGSDLHVMVKGTSSDGQAISIHFTVPSGGGQEKIIESPYEAVSATNVNANNERDSSFSKGGKVVYTAGKTLGRRKDHDGSRQGDQSIWPDGDRHQLLRQTVADTRT